MCKKNKRPETGAMVFGDDWPGVFIRGDNAAWYAFVLSNFLEKYKQKNDCSIEINTLEGLAKVLGGCLVSNGNLPANLQKIEDFNKVLLEENK